MTLVELLQWSKVTSSSTRLNSCEGFRQFNSFEYNVENLVFFPRLALKFIFISVFRNCDRNFKRIYCDALTIIITKTTSPSYTTLKNY